MYSTKKIKKNYKNQFRITFVSISIFLVMFMLPAQKSYSYQIFQIAIVEVQSLGLPQGIENHLTGILYAAKMTVQNNQYNNNAAIQLMQVFISAVEIHRGTIISNADADFLIWRANNIITFLEDCPYCGGFPCVPPCDGTGGGGAGL